MTSSPKGEQIEKVTDEYYSQEFNNVNEELRKYVKKAHNEIDNVKDTVNELVVIVHKDNKTWSARKICDYIAGRNDDLEILGFSSRTIFNYLNEENRQLVDTKIYKRKKGDSKQNNVIEQSHESVHGNVLEQSSSNNSTGKQQQYQPSSALEEFRKQQGTIIEKEEEEEEEYEDPDTPIYDSEFVENLIKENAELKKENAELKKELAKLKQGVKK